MDIIGLKKGHDGSICLIRDSELIYSYENEKDGRDRYSPLQVDTILNAMRASDRLPDVIAEGGWARKFLPEFIECKPRYFGHSNDARSVGSMQIFGQSIRHFQSTHERSHILGAYGMSPYETGTPCYCLVWEGLLGTLYWIDGQGSVEKVAEGPRAPGNKYNYFYYLANRHADDTLDFFPFSYSGKLMALAAYGDAAAGGDLAENRALLEEVLGNDQWFYPSKVGHRTHPLYNSGVESREAKDFFAYMSNTIFNTYRDMAERVVDRDAPLLISGGCGLNCEWNSRWAESGLFTDIFVPPVPNDTGSAIGSAIDAQEMLTGDAKVRWSVYAGPDYVYEETRSDLIDLGDTTPDKVAWLLARGGVVGLARGAAEIGPRALGNRSILAAPFEKTMLERLNRIKQREDYRPIAPMCLEEDFERHFSGAVRDKYMLFFSRVVDDRLQAVTHVDGSARVQCVSRADNPFIHDLLTEFRKLTGVGVLCNTSLNFNGVGFINRSTDLMRFLLEKDLDAIVEARGMTGKGERAKALMTGQGRMVLT